MHPVVSASISTLFASCITNGCVLIPYPLPSHGDLHRNEDNIQELLEDSASRNDVITTLGNPAREYESDLSYLGCYEPAGYGIILVPLFPSPYGLGGDVYRDPEQCYEFILHFDNNHRLASFKKQAFEGHLTVPDSTLQMYWNDPRHKDAKQWLCRAADEGDAQAQYRLGLLYEKGVEGLTQNFVMAYVWYRLSEANGDYMRSGDQANRILEKLDAGQSMRAERLIRDWKPGFCIQQVIQSHGLLND